MHIVLVETTSVRGFDVVAEMADAGIEVSFITADLAAYLGTPGAELMSKAARVIEVDGLAEADDLSTRLVTWLGSKPDGVICRDEVFLYAAACLARDFGLPHEDLEAARVLGSKAAVRAKLLAAGVGSLRWRDVFTLDQGEAAITELGLPIVVKPVAGGWSVGVTIAWTREEAICALKELLSCIEKDASIATPALLEEYRVGRHVSAEMLVQDGNPTLLGFGERVPAPPGVTAELGGCFPAVVPDMDMAERFARDVVAAVGIRNSALHIELMLTTDGPELIEVNGRIAGHVVSRQMSIALGRSIAMDLVALAVGQPIAEVTSQPRTVALRQLWSWSAGVVDSVDRIATMPDGVDAWGLWITAGDRVEALTTNRSRFGYVLASGPSRQASKATADCAAERILAAIQYLPADEGDDADRATAT